MPNLTNHDSDSQSNYQGKIPDSFIDELLDRIDLTDIISNRVNLKRTGKNLMGLCPFHKEKTPSFSVNPEKQLYHCFSCGAGGNAIKFLMELDKLSFPEVIEQLAQHAGLEVPRSKASQFFDAQIKQNAPIYSSLTKTAEAFTQILHSAQGQNAQHYLKQRGLSEEVTTLFQLGYAPPGWNYLSKHADNSKSSQDQPLLKAGLIIKKDEGSYYDRFRHRLMFPIRDTRGRVIAFGGRVLGDDKPKYLNSPETVVFQKNKELYGLYECKKQRSKIDRILVVEGYMDVLALFQHGINYCVATLGTATNGFHLEKLFRITPEIIFCFDGDNAGRNAASRALETTLSHLKDGKQAKFLFLPEGEDPDTLVRKEGTSTFERRIHSATPLPEYLFDFYSQQIQLNTLDGKAKLHQLLAPKIRSVPSKLMQELMSQHLAELTGLNKPPSSTHSESNTSQHSKEFNQTTQSTSPQLRAQKGYLRAPSENKHKVLTNLEKAIKIILHFPYLAETVKEELISANIDSNDDNKERPFHLLKELVTVITSGSMPPAAAILFHFYHHPQYAVIEALALQENLLANHQDSHLEKQLKDSINKVLEEERGLQLKALYTKTDLTDSEKDTLKTLLSARKSS